ncbi:hypothetical protein [Paraburkholderia sp. JPY419]|uniref:hypothetical protein n=1 Tax=Paraburkholderia sp. JPY419 TaxID=667660 RepID=UPI003D253698
MPQTSTSINRDLPGAPGLRKDGHTAPVGRRRNGTRMYRLGAALQRHAREVVVVALLVVLLFPFLWLVQLALRPADTIFDDGLLFKPTLDAFRGLFHSSFVLS